MAKAKGFISAFMEQTMLRGKINPASGIFLLKNWCGYRDNISFDVDNVEHDMMRPQESAVEIAKRRLKPPTMPVFDDDVNE